VGLSFGYSRTIPNQKIDKIALTLSLLLGKHSVPVNQHYSTRCYDFSSGKTFHIRIVAHKRVNDYTVSVTLLYF